MVSTLPPGLWLAPWTSQIDLMVSADAVEVRNDLQGGPHPKAIENKKTEYVLSEILVPVRSQQSNNDLNIPLVPSPLNVHCSALLPHFMNSP